MSGQAKSEQSSVHVSYGILEPIPGEYVDEVHVPAVFLAAPAQTLPVTRRQVIGRKRFERWEEEGRTMGRWTWERCS